MPAQSHPSRPGGARTGPAAPRRPGADLSVSAVVAGLIAVVGACVVGSPIVLAVGLSGAFDRVIRLLPRAVAGAVPAGILLRFGIDVFVSLGSAPAMVAAMCLAYVALRRIGPRHAIVGVLVTGCAFAAAGGRVDAAGVSLALATPVLVLPARDWRAAVNIGVPLAVVTLAGQNLPGMAVLRGAGYGTPARPLLSVIGVASVAASSFASHGFGLAAVTAAICAPVPAPTRTAAAATWRASPRAASSSSWAPSAAPSPRCSRRCRRR